MKSWYMVDFFFCRRLALTLRETLQKKFQCMRVVFSDALMRQFIFGGMGFVEEQVSSEDEELQLVDFFFSPTCAHFTGRLHKKIFNACGLFSSDAIVPVFFDQALI